MGTEPTTDELKIKTIPNTNYGQNGTSIVAKEQHSSVVTPDASTTMSSATTTSQATTKPINDALPAAASKLPLPQLQEHASTKLQATNDYQREYNTAVAAALSSLASTFVGFPFDSVKTRMQAYKFKSVLDCVMVTKKTEGVRGFFRGVGAPMVSVSIVRTLSFSIYAQSKATYTSMVNSVMGEGYVVDPSGPAVLTEEQLASPGKNLLRSLPTYFLSGFTAGGFIAMFSCPFEFTKLSTQIEMLMARAAVTGSPDAAKAPVSQPKGALESAKEIVRRRGILGLYSGFKYHFARDALGTSLYFSVYEASKQLSIMYNPSNVDPGPLVIAISGGLCGIFSWAVLFPIDTMKSIVQRDILTRKPGEVFKPRKFQLLNPRMYRGLGVSVVRTGLVNMTFFSIFEPLFKHLMKTSDSAILPLEA
ncbi:mitochondrial carrier domain-containing protein [Kockiozyma suomiensis]|uniref:mitochondrial carrier domain-containing protein n=1 Tax=Kockiozyma suomiensis TaxID=1337062 RepID=UPI003342FF0C